MTEPTETESTRVDFDSGNQSHRGGDRLFGWQLRPAVHATLYRAIPIILGCCAAACTLAGDPFSTYELEMYEEPPVEVTAPKIEFPDGLIELWIRALDRSDGEVQRNAMNTIALAHRRGMKGLDKAIPQMVSILGQPDQPLPVVQAAAGALITLDAREHADALGQVVVQRGEAAARLIEPALARWKANSLKDQWLQRVNSSSSEPSDSARASRASLIAAIEGLGALEITDGTDSLKRLLQDPLESTVVRLASAKALGKIHSSGLTELASQFLNSESGPNPLNPLIAIALLQRHDDPDAIKLLHRLVSDDSAAIQSGALGRLLEIDPRHVDEHIDDLLRSQDVNVRRWCVSAMIATEDFNRIELLSSMLDDVNPMLRNKVAAAMQQFARQSRLRDEVLRCSMKVLGRNSWRGCEQAAVILVRLDHKPAGKRLVELLGHQRGEVKVASAWGLRKLQIPELLPDMLEHSQGIYDGVRNHENVAGLPEQVAQLFMAYGQQRYSEAEPLMREYIPRRFNLGVPSRAAAVWATGWLHKDDPQADLVKMMLARLNDVLTSTTEYDEIRQMCVVSLVRMNATSALRHFRKYAIPIRGDLMSRVSFWGIEQFTGEVPPPTPKLPAPYRDWFLAPL